MSDPTPQWILLHGWGGSGHVMQPVQQQVERMGSAWAPDLPGFGEEPPPPTAWGVEEYAQWIFSKMNVDPTRPLIVVGHSFGGRVALKMAALHPEKISALVLIAGAGLRLPKPWWKRAYTKTVQMLARGCRQWLPTAWGEQLRSRILHRIASRDYLQAGALRPTFLKVIHEDLTETARQVQSPTLLLYGSEDTETPPLMGKRFAEAIPRSFFFELSGFDHDSILREGVHQVWFRVQTFLKLHQNPRSP